MNWKEKKPSIFQDLNPGPLSYEACALPLCHNHIIISLQTLSHLLRHLKLRQRLNTNGFSFDVRFNEVGQICATGSRFGYFVGLHHLVGGSTGPRYSCIIACSVFIGKKKNKLAKTTHLSTGISAAAI